MPIYSEESPKRVMLANPGKFLPMTIGKNILNVAYKKLGIEVQFIDLPAKRSLIESNQGKYDGEASRIWTITNYFPNLVRVPTPINYIEQSLYATKEHDISSCEQLKNYSVGIRRGVKHAEECSAYTRRVVVFNDSNQMMKVLNAGRIDFVINARLHGLPFENNDDFPNILLIQPPLKRINLYHCLHKSNAILLDRIDEVLRLMAESGELEAIRKQTIQDYTAENRK